MKRLCTKSVEQPTETGFICFVKGIEYDLDKMKFHSDSKENESIKDSVRSACFKEKITNMDKAKKNTGGKVK